MIIRQNDSNNDWIFGQSKNNYIAGNYAVLQNLKTKLQEWKRNCFFNLQAGIDWQTRLGYKGQKNLLDTDIKDIIINDDEVVTLDVFESNLDESERDYTCHFGFTTIYGGDMQYLDINLGDLINA